MNQNNEINEFNNTAIFYGAFAVITSSLIWGFISFLLDFQIGWMAVGVGALIGLSIRHFGKGDNYYYGILGAMLSLFACVLGNVILFILVLTKKFNTSPIILIFKIGRHPEVGGRLAEST